MKKFLGRIMLLGVVAGCFWFCHYAYRVVNTANTAELNIQLENTKVLVLQKSKQIEDLETERDNLRGILIEAGLFHEDNCSYISDLD